MVNAALRTGSAHQRLRVGGRERLGHLVEDAAIGADQVRLWNARDPEIDPGSAVGVNENRLVGIAVAGEEGAGLGRVVLVGDAHDADAPGLQRGQRVGLLRAGGARGGGGGAPSRPGSTTSGAAFPTVARGTTCGS